MNPDTISFQDYLACGAPEETIKVLEAHGYHAPGPGEVKEAVDLFIKEKGDEAIMALAKSHPDKELIKQAEAAGKKGLDKQQPRD